MDWKGISQKAQQDLLERIPAEWWIEKAKYQAVTNVTGIPRETGILTEKQLAITESTVIDLAKQLAARQLTAVEVLTAFAARTAIAHQLVGLLV